MQDEIMAEAVKAFWGSKFGPDVPPRYMRLIREVAERLPEGWDDHAEWTITANTAANSRGYANVLPFEEGAGEYVTDYVVMIYPAMLGRLSDPAARWVFAHEFGHIASKLRQGSITLFGKAYTRGRGNEYIEAPSKNIQEDAADRIALEWGFGVELQAFLQEEELLCR